jgi:predicted glycosyltransferase
MIAATPGEVNRHKKIWVDLDNSPHVPFFVPIIRELERRGFSVVVTARRCFQVCDLAEMFHLKYTPVGRHFGRHKSLKAVGLLLRSLQLLPTALRGRPALALSHGSRSQTIASAVLGIPSIVILDYEYAEFLPVFKPTWVIAPDVIPEAVLRIEAHRVFRYPGIKEDVYTSTFTPDSDIMSELSLDQGDIIVTVRPPANEAHYHNPEGDHLFRTAIDRLIGLPDTKIVMMPRNAKQADSVQRTWPEAFARRKMIIPGRAVNGLNLIWHSDLVISGGGTMNREAAAMGVPVYSVFRGTIGAVDRYLASRGRLVLLDSVEDVRTKLVVERRKRSAYLRMAENGALSTIVDHIVAALYPQSANGNACGSVATR